MKEIILKVEGMMCEGCENRIKNAVSKIENVQKVAANHKEGTVIITAKDSIDETQIKEKIDDLGFEVKE